MLPERAIVGTSEEMARQAHGAPNVVRGRGRFTETCSSTGSAAVIAGLTRALLAAR